MTTETPIHWMFAEGLDRAERAGIDSLVAIGWALRYGPDFALLVDHLIEETLKCATAQTLSYALSFDATSTVGSGTSGTG